MVLLSERYLHEVFRLKNDSVIHANGLAPSDEAGHIVAREERARSGRHVAADDGTRANGSHEAGAGQARMLFAKCHG